MKEEKIVFKDIAENTWICRAGKNREYEKQFLEQGFIGFHFDTDLGKTKPDDFKETKRKMEKYYTGRELSHNASIVYTLSKRMDLLDFVLLPMKTGTRKYQLGVIISECIHEEVDEFNFKRKVMWIAEVDKDLFSEKTKNSMGSLLPLFKVNITEEDREKLLALNKKVAETIFK